MSSVLPNLKRSALLCELAKPCQSSIFVEWLVIPDIQCYVVVVDLGVSVGAAKNAKQGFSFLLTTHQIFNSESFVIFGNFIMNELESKKDEEEGAIMKSGLGFLIRVSSPKRRRRAALEVYDGQDFCTREMKCFEDFIKGLPNVKAFRPSENISKPDGTPWSEDRPFRKRKRWHRPF